MQSQAALTQSHALLTQTATLLLNRLGVLEQENAARGARIESLLQEHRRILAALPDTIGEAIGLQPSNS